ncbi:class I SAM-dependent methyltransferase [Nanoarchaeota archaeon]
MTDYKEVTKNLFNRYAKEFEGRYTKEYSEYIRKEADFFMDLLKGKKILDLGCGPGRDSVYFKKNGFEPTALDFSSEMVKLARNKGLDAMIGDIEDLPFSVESFDGIWAHTSLLHIPKVKIEEILSNIYETLKEQGVFLLGLKKGNVEGIELNPKYQDEGRYMAYYSKDEAKQLISKHFDIKRYSEITLEENNYFNYIGVKK